MSFKRSTEAPMDWQYTSRPEIKPAWAADATPKKRSHEELNQQAQAPTFGTNQNVPFLFNPTPAPPTQPAYPWSPANVSPEKASVEVLDVDMTDASPLRSDEPNKRPVAPGALQRVFRSRHRAKSRHRSVGLEDDEHDESSDEEGPIAVTRTTSNHYTLNMPSPAPPKSDLPYILSGYLQFFFNLSLILLFLYLVVQFILTVQRDVEHRISEYSMDIVQEIAMCATQFKNNGCEHPMPVLVQQCASWETCMNRDPTIVGRAKVGAELVAEVVNGFVEPISWKALAFTLTSLSFLTVFINTLLSLYRSRHQPAGKMDHPPPSLVMPPGPFVPHQIGHWTREEQPMEETARRRRLEGGGIEKVK